MVSEETELFPNQSCGNYLGLYGKPEKQDIVNRGFLG